MTRGIGSLKSGGYSYHHHHHRSHRSTQLRLHCLSKRHKWSAARLSAAIGGGLSLSLSLTLLLSGCLPPWMTMSMTNHGQHVKNLSWNIWAVNLEEQFLFPKLNSFLKLVHKYCYKCVESKQLETNERSTAFPGTACSLSLPFGSTSSGWLQFMNHLKDEGPHSIEPNTYHLNTQIQLEHASGTYDNISTWATWQI